MFENLENKFGSSTESLNATVPSTDAEDGTAHKNSTATASSLNNLNRYDEGPTENTRSPELDLLREYTDDTL